MFLLTILIKIYFACLYNRINFVMNGDAIRLNLLIYVYLFQWFDEYQKQLNEINDEYCILEQEIIDWHRRFQAEQRNLSQRPLYVIACCLLLGSFMVTLVIGEDANAALVLLCNLYMLLLLYSSHSMYQKFRIICFWMFTFGYFCLFGAHIIYFKVILCLYNAISNSVVLVDVISRLMGFTFI